MSTIVLVLCAHPAIGTRKANALKALGYGVVLWSDEVCLAPFYKADAVFYIDTHVSNKDPVETVELCRAIKSRWQIPVVLTTTRPELKRLQTYEHFIDFSHDVRPVCNLIEAALDECDDEECDIEAWRSVLVDMGGVR